MESISIRLRSKAETCYLHISFMDLLYSKIRKRFIKNNAFCGHYYREDNIPQFVLYYKNKPLPDKPLHYTLFNIHEYDYIDLEYIGLLGGTPQYGTNRVIFSALGDELDVEYLPHHSIEQIAISLGCTLFELGLTPHPRGAISVSIQSPDFEYPEMLPVLNWSIPLSSYSHCEFIFKYEELLHQRLFGTEYYFRWPMDDWDFDTSDYSSASSFDEQSLILRISDASDATTHCSSTDLDLDDLSLSDAPFSEQSGEIPWRTRVRFYRYVYSKTQFDKEYIFKLAEDLLILVEGLHDSFEGEFSIRRIVRTLVVFLKLRNNTSIISLFENSAVLDYIMCIFDSVNEESGFMRVVDGAETLINTLKTGKKLKFAKVLYRLGMFAMTLSLFDSFGLTFDLLGYSKFDQELIKRKNEITGDTLLDLADGIVFLLKKGYQIILTKQIDCIYHTDDEYSALYDDIADLKLKKVALGNPEALGFNEYWYGDKLDKTIAQLRSIIKYSDALDKNEIRYWRSQMCELELIKNNILIAKNCSESRECPFSLLFFASPGVGKSTLTKMTFQHLAKTHDLPTDDKFMYVRNPMAKYADGFKSEMHTYLLDDISFKHPAANPTGDVSLDEVYMLHGTFQYVPDQAALEDKGRIPVRIKFLLGTTNVRDLNAYHYFSVPSAMQRRFPYIVEVNVKKQYQMDDGSGMLDANKADCLPDEYPNYWILKVSKIVVPKNMSELAKLRPINTFHDINEFTRWLSEASVAHFKNERIMTDSFSNMREVQICKVCYKNVKCCCCVSEQSGVTDTVLTTTSATDTVLSTAAYFFALWIYYFYRSMACILFGTTYWKVRLFTENTLERMNQYKINEFVRKRMFVNLAHLSRKRMGYPAAFGVLAGLLVTCYAVFKFKRSVTNSQFSEQTSEQPREYAKTDERPPKPGSFEKELTWVANDKKLCTMDLTPEILSSKQHTREDFNARVSRNVIRLIITNTTTKQRYVNNAIVVRSNIVLCNAHFFHNVDQQLFDMMIISDVLGDGVNDAITVSMNKSLIYFELDRDIAIFTVNSLVPRRDITAYFAKPDVYTEATCTLIGRDFRHGNVQYNTVHGVTLQNDYTDNWGSHPFKGPATIGRSVIITVDGDCGSMLVAHTPKGHFITGFHRAGNTNRVVIGVVVYQDTLMELLSKVTSLAVNAGDLSASIKHELQSLHPKSVFNYIENGSALVYGSISNFKSNQKSRVCATPMRSYLVEKADYPVDYRSPQLHGYKPYYLAGKDLVNPITKFDDALLSICAKSFLSDILCNVPLDDIKEIVHKYDLFTVINGAAGVAFVDAINKSTSTGYPYCTPKKHFLYKARPQRGLQDPVTIDVEFELEMDRMRDEYAAGRRCYPVFKGTLKDEPVSFEKYTMGKTRLFGSAPLAYILLQRTYYLSIIRLMQTHKMAFECAIGVIAQTKEWELFYKKLSIHPNLIAGDFSKFDKQMCPHVIMLAYWILIEIARLSGNYTDEDIQIMYGIATDTAYPFMLFNGDFVQLFGSNPSGHSLTVIINSLVNCIYLRYVYVLLYKQHVSDQESDYSIACSFQNHIQLFVYGDDNQASTDTNWFNFRNIQATFASLGIKYTPPTKDDSNYDFMDISEVDFLKRSYRYDRDLDAIVAPLATDSLNKMLTTWVASDTISPEVQVLAVLASAIREYFFHGRNTFETKRELFTQILVHLKLEHGINTTVLPTYEMLVERYNDASTKVLARLPQHSFQLQSGSIIASNSTFESTFSYRALIFVFSIMGTMVGFILAILNNVITLYSILKRFIPNRGTWGSGIVMTRPTIDPDWWKIYVNYEVLYLDNWAALYFLLMFTNIILIYWMFYLIVFRDRLEFRPFIFVVHSIFFVVYNTIPYIELFIIVHLFIAFAVRRLSLYIA